MLSTDMVPLHVFIDQQKVIGKTTHDNQNDADDKVILSEGRIPFDAIVYFTTMCYDTLLFRLEKK